jgi:hypothetical protein
VNDFLPKSFEKMGFYVPYCGAKSGGRPKIWTHRVANDALAFDESVKSGTRFKAGHTAIFGEDPLPM